MMSQTSTQPQTSSTDTTKPHTSQAYEVPFAIFFFAVACFFFAILVPSFLHMAQPISAQVL
jgi:hypothetical protein